MAPIAGRLLKKAKEWPFGSGRDAVPKVPPEFENLDWLSNHINHMHEAISNLRTQEISDNEESAGLAVDTLDEGRDLQSQVPEAESLDSRSVSKRLPSSISSNSSPVEEAQRKREAIVIKKKRAWSSQKAARINILKRTLTWNYWKLLNRLQKDCKQIRGLSEIEDEDTFYFKSLAARMRSLDPLSVRIYEETLKRNTTLIHWTRLHIDLQRACLRVKCYDVQKSSITRAGTRRKFTWHSKSYTLGWG